MGLLITGILLCATSWAVAWSRVPLYSEHAFFPLWLGYILVANGLTEWLYRDSLIRRMRFSFLLLFLISIPFWWFFEFINLTVKNWNYVFPRPISQINFAIQASIDFSTVVPAVLSASFLASKILSARTRIRFPGFEIRRRWLSVSILIGVVSLCLLGLIPDLTFPLVWIAPTFIVEPFIYSLGYRSLLAQVKKGDWTHPVAIMLATFVTGIFWEMWNFYSLPKWVYTIPYIGFWKIFEMPFLGYFGYPFFGIIVYSFTVFMFSVLANGETARGLVPWSDSDQRVAASD
jgi:hypothetical protein